MKINKKAVTLLSFTIGACVFVSTAMADMAIGSGYDQLKASAKTTAAQMEKGLNNYTIETLFTLEDNGQTLMQTAEVKKIDNVHHAMENKNTNQLANGETNSYYAYSDPERSIWKNGTEDKYYETDNRDPGKNNPAFSDPFEQSGALEAEKIVDALVGNLKDYVQAEASADGGRVYTGSLSEAQVPAVINALSSFYIKQLIGNQERQPVDGSTRLPNIDRDVFVKSATGRAVEDKAGLLENVTADVALSGKDKAGVQHDLALNVVFKLSDIGTTKVGVPDTSGKTIEKVSQAGGFTSAYIGTYTSNIVMEKDGQFVKIGERTLEITGVQDGKVTGKYSETVKPGFETEYPAPYSFSFVYNPGSDPMSLFTYTGPKGKQEQGRLNPGGGAKVYLELNVEILGKNSYRSGDGIKYFDGEFDRVFGD